MLARNGKTPTEIGKLLTDERTLVPSEIVGNGHTRKDGIKRGWNRNTVKRILQNVTYLGWVSNGNTKKINYKSKKTMIMPIEDRIIKKGMHTPIIDEETFNIVQDMIKSRTSTRVKSYDWLLKGLVCCKECGKKLSLVPQKHPNKTTFYLRCNTYATNTHLGLCTPHSNNLEKVTNFVIEQIKKRCKEFLSEEKYTKIAKTSKDKIIKDRFNVKNEILILEKKIKDINKRIDKLYEDKYNGLFEDEDFKWLRVLNCLKNTNMPIKKIKRYVDLAQEGDATLKERQQLIQEQKQNILDQIKQFQYYLQEIEYKEWYYKF